MEQKGSLESRPAQVAVQTAILCHTFLCVEHEKLVYGLSNEIRGQAPFFLLTIRILNGEWLGSDYSAHEIIHVNQIIHVYHTFQIRMHDEQRVLNAVFLQIFYALQFRWRAIAERSV